MAQYNELPVYKAAYDLLLHLFQLTHNLSREYKFTLGEKLKNTITDVLTNIYRANRVHQKADFIAQAREGLPIGNLTSQLFGNVYLNAFDHYIKRELGIKYYGRYVDDFVLIHKDKHFLMGLIPEIADFLSGQLQLQLHPGKIYLQHYSKGLPYLGTVIKPHRIYVARRIKGNLYQAIEKHNAIARDHKPTADEQAAFISSINSYLGIMKHYKTYKMRKGLVFKNLSAWWWNMIRAAGYKLVLRRRWLATQNFGLFANQ